ncbi:hypothetical protein ACTA71_011804 [Dictyostelium dimigraforme]
MKTTQIFSILFFTISLLICIPNATSQTLSTTITLIVDFGSTTPYLNSECGGVLQNGDTTVYPPCKSFKDVGDRARQYLNSGLTIPNSNSLSISIINTAITPSISGQSAQLGNLYGFCTIDVSSATTSSRANIYGTLSTSNFVSLEEPIVPNTSYQCSTGRLLRMKYMEFKNWENQTIIYTNLNQVFNSYTKQTITLAAVYTWSSNSFINVQPKSSSIEYGSVVFTCSTCYFNTIVSSLSLPPFNFNGVNVNFVGTRFLNSTLNSSPFIYSNIGSFAIKPASFVDNVIINNGYPFAKTLNVGDNFYYSSITVSNCVFSKFVQHDNNQVNAPRETTIQHLVNIYLNNNTITSNDYNDPFNSFFSFQNYLGVTYTLVFNSIYSSGNIVLSQNKSFVSNQNSNTASTFAEPPSAFQVGFNTENSNTDIAYSSIFSNIPFVGKNSIFTFSSSGDRVIENSTNYNICGTCQIIVDQDIKYDNL